MKRLVTKPNEYGIGIDVGWQFIDVDGQGNREEAETIWWGNCKDNRLVPELAKNLRAEGYEFEYDAAARQGESEAG